MQKLSEAETKISEAVKNESDVSTNEPGAEVKDPQEKAGNPKAKVSGPGAGNNGAGARVSGPGADSGGSAAGGSGPGSGADEPEPGVDDPSPSSRGELSETGDSGIPGGQREGSGAFSPAEAEQDILVDRNWVKNWNSLKQPKPPLVKNIINAFFYGGIVCTLGQVILNTYVMLGVPVKDAGNPTVATVIFIAALLTGFGVFDRIALVAGAGIMVPVTGFANSVTSMAIEFRREGLVLGTGAKMFGLAGSVIVFGVITAFVVGLISVLI